MALLTLVALFFSIDFAIVGSALLLRAFIISNKHVKDLQAAIPKGTILKVDRHDIMIPGEVAAAAQVLIPGLVIASAYVVLNRSKFRSKFFVILSSLLSFASIWLLSAILAFTIIFATKSARVSASIGGVQLPQSIINAQAQKLGVSPVYKVQSYLLHAAVLSWFTWLFTTIAAAAMFLESRAGSTPVARDAAPLNDKSTTGVRRESTPSIA